MTPLVRMLLASGVTAACLAAQDPTKPAEPPPPITFKDLIRSGSPIKIYGFFRLDAYYGTARMDNVIIPSRVLPETENTPITGEAKRNDDQFALDPRLTRLGIDVNVGEVHGAKVMGKLEIDFANFPTGSTESRATPRIRLAYADVAQDQWGLRVGQDWDVVSPLFPAVNGELLMWNAGNTGDRRAQIQGRYAPSAGFDLKAALALTGAINNEDLDGGTLAGERDGFDSGLPQVQVRAGTKPFELVEKKPTELGLWAMYGRTETDTFFANENRWDTWLAGVDFQMPLNPSFVVRGEAWTGANLGDVRGGIGQTINTTTGEEIASSGGWAELIWSCTAKTKYHVGATVDDPENDDLNAALSNRRRNQSAYLGTIVDWDTGLRTGFDVIYWQTDYMGANGTNGSSGNAVRCNLYFQLTF